MFFIFGLPRSGTTLLAQCLNAHPELAVPHETDFIIPMAFLLDRVKESAVGRPLIAQLIVHSAYFQGSLGEFLSPAEVSDIVESSPYSAWALLQAIYSRVAEKAGARLAGDKSPNDLNFLRMLVKVGGLPPQAKVIHIVRDVRDMMISVNQAGWVPDLDAYFPRFWNNNNLYLKAIMAPRPQSYLLMRYEELAANPERELARACEFLGVDFLPDILSPDQRHQRYRHNPLHQNLYKPISTGSVGLYRSQLSAELQARYIIQAREALEAFGYPCEVSVAGGSAA